MTNTLDEATCCKQWNTSYHLDQPIRTEWEAEKQKKHSVCLCIYNEIMSAERRTPLASPYGNNSQMLSLVVTLSTSTSWMFVTCTWKCVDFFLHRFVYVVCMCGFKWFQFVQVIYWHFWVFDNQALRRHINFDIESIIHKPRAKKN